MVYKWLLAKPSENAKATDCKAGKSGKKSRILTGKKILFYRYTVSEAVECIERKKLCYQFKKYNDIISV